MSILITMFNCNFINRSSKGMREQLFVLTMTRFENYGRETAVKVSLNE